MQNKNSKTKSQIARPDTPRAKSVARANAVTHGMTAKQLLPEILGHDRIDEKCIQLREELQPQTATEKFLVRELARHEAVLDQIEQIEQAALRRSSRAAVRLAERCEQDAAQLVDVALAGAGTADAIDKITRYRRTHERAYLKSLAALGALRESRATATTTPASAAARGPACATLPSWRFSTEDQCNKYLLERRVKQGCPRCKSDNGTLLRARQIWQCRDCRAQSSPRSGTVLEGSRLPSLPWFRAVELLLKNPDAELCELISATGIERQATVRKMAARLRGALSASDAQSALADLPEFLAAEGSC